LLARAYPMGERSFPQMGQAVVTNRTRVIVVMVNLLSYG